MEKTEFIKIVSNRHSRISKDYWHVLVPSGMFQIFFGMFAWLGQTIPPNAGIQIYGFTLAAYWSLFALMIARRPHSPTRWDIRILQWGFPILLLLVVFPLALWIWKLQYPLLR